MTELPPQYRTGHLLAGLSQADLHYPVVRNIANSNSSLLCPKVMVKKTISHKAFRVRRFIQNSGAMVVDYAFY